MMLKTACHAQQIVKKSLQPKHHRVCRRFCYDKKKLAYNIAINVSFVQFLSFIKEKIVTFAAKFNYTYKNMCKNIILALMSILVLCPIVMHGQNSTADFQKMRAKQLEEFRKKSSTTKQGYADFKRKKFENYRKMKNADFAKYLQQEWVMMPKEEGLPALKQPDPVEPVVVPKEEADALPEQPVEVPQGEVMPLEVPEEEVPFEIPLPEHEVSAVNECMQVDLFGMSLDINMSDTLRFSLKSLEESEIADIWDELSGDDYTPMFDDCARYTQEMRLNGWATMNLCKAIGEQLEGKGTNEAVLLQTYLMTQLGFDARIARLDNDKLVMLCPANVKLCQIPSIKMNGKQYYIWGESSGEVHTYSNNFDAATRSIDFAGGTLIRLNDEQTIPRTFTSKWNSEASVQIGVNKCLMNYYSDMPLINDWSFYARQSMEQNISQQIMPVLRRVVEGKAKLAAVNELLHFVQTAFEYQTDEAQFGREKTNFKEETFYYPACDCEDRAILFSELVYTLLGLDVVLLHYPNHLCAAVKFEEDINGDFVSVDGQKYVICDPTYINASAGSCMPKFKTAKPTIYKIFING